MEDRFVFYGGGISFIGIPDEPPDPQASDPTTPVKGPCSVDFRWVTLPEGPNGPIRLTEAQASVFKSLWSFRGEPMDSTRRYGPRCRRGGDLQPIICGPKRPV